MSGRFFVTDLANVRLLHFWNSTTPIPYQCMKKNSQNIVPKISFCVPQKWKKKSQIFLFLVEPFLEIISISCYLMISRLINLGSTQRTTKATDGNVFMPITHLSFFVINKNHIFSESTSMQREREWRSSQTWCWRGYAIQKCEPSPVPQWVTHCACTLFCL